LFELFVHLLLLLKLLSFDLSVVQVSKLFEYLLLLLEG
jgi:hypothetical protein